MTIQNASLALIISCGLFLIALGLFFHYGIPKRPVKPKWSGAPRRPIGVAYLEMFDKIYYADEVSDMNCIKALLKDYMEEYQRHEFPQVLQSDYRTIKKMRLDKISEIRGTVSRVLV